MKISRRQLRKLIMEMPMGGYFGSMHGGTGEDFISAVEMEAMKYPEYSIYIDDASNNPNEFVISSSRRDDAMGPQSHYLTSIHVEVQERDGMIYIDGQPFSSYEQAAAQILVDLEDERQYSIMSESVYGTGKRGYAKRRPENPLMHVSPEVRKKLEPLIHHDDEDFQRQGYDLATTLQRDMTVFPFEGEPNTRKPYEGDDYLADLEKSKTIYGNFLEIYTNLKNAYEAAEVKLTPEVGNNLMDAFNEAYTYTKELAKAMGMPHNTNSEEVSDLYDRLFRSALTKD